MALFRTAKPRFRNVHCPRCGGRQEIAASAQSVVCHFCHRTMQVLDHNVSHFSAATELATCGAVSVEHKARVIVHKRVVAGTLILHGTLSGDAVVYETARISSGARMQGTLKAQSLVIEDGAEFSGYVEIGPNPDDETDDSNRELSETTTTRASQ